MRVTSYIKNTSSQLSYLMLGTAVGIGLFFSIAIYAKESSRILPIPTAKLSSKLRSVGYATIRTSLQKRWDFVDPRDYRYLPCSEEFPKLPGDFPCNFLTLPIPESPPQPGELGETTDDGVLSETMEGGFVSAFTAKPVSSYSGTVLLLGEGDEALTLFYFKNGNLSHYRLGDQLVVFVWQKQKGEETLVRLYQFRLDAELFPSEGKEIVFQTP